MSARLSPAMRRALADARRVRGAWIAPADAKRGRTVEALRRRGLVAWDGFALTEAGVAARERETAGGPPETAGAPPETTAERPGRSLGRGEEGRRGGGVIEQAPPPPPSSSPSQHPFDPPKRRKLSTRERVRIFERAGGVCHLCGGRIQVGEAWEVEHVVALTRGGEDGGENLRPAHVKCHRRKTREDAKAAAKERRLYAKHRGADARRSRFATARDGAFKQKIGGAIERRRA